MPIKAYLWTWPRKVEVDQQTLTHAEFTIGTINAGIGTLCMVSSVGGIPTKNEKEIRKMC